MSRRHEQQGRKRKQLDGYAQRGPTYAVRQSRRVARHDTRKGRTEHTAFYVVFNRETDETIGEEFSSQVHAARLAERLNGTPARKRRDAAQKPTGTLSLPAQVDAILRAKGLMFWKCGCGRTPDRFSIRETEYGSVIVRAIPAKHLPKWGIRAFRTPSAHECTSALSRAGLGVVEDEDKDVPFLRITPRVL